MKLLPISKITTNISTINSYKGENNEAKPLHKKEAFGYAVAGGVLATGATAFFIIRHKRTHKIFDKPFKNELQQALASEGINVSLKDLKSIVGKDEFSDLIKKYKRTDFQAGLQTVESKPLEEFYKNAIDGNFRVSLHTHSNFSDGKATPEEFLECARKYADKVAAQKHKDGLPPFMIALTDHDSIDGCKEIVRIIAKDPEKYKNLKFVSGCEFSVKNGDIKHDITGLALNPFDKGIADLLKDLKDKRKTIIEEFITEKNKEFNKNVTYDEIINYEKDYYKTHGKEGRSSFDEISGTVAIKHAIKYYYKMIGKEPDVKEMKEFSAKYLLPVETVVDKIVQNNGHASLTHPIKSFGKYIGDDFLMNLKNIGVKGIEANHQYTPSRLKKIGEKAGSAEDAETTYKAIRRQYEDFAYKNDMFLTGGTDSHDKQIFSHEPKITPEVLEKILN